MKWSQRLREQLKEINAAVGQPYFAFSWSHLERLGGQFGKHSGWLDSRTKQTPLTLTLAFFNNFNFFFISCLQERDSVKVPDILTLSLVTRPTWHSSLTENLMPIWCMFRGVLFWKQLFLTLPLHIFILFYNSVTTIQCSIFLIDASCFCSSSSRLCLVE